MLINNTVKSEVSEISTILSFIYPMAIIRTEKDIDIEIDMYTDTHTSLHPNAKKHQHIYIMLPFTFKCVLGFLFCVWMKLGN